jgi:hypothetical protein
MAAQFTFLIAQALYQVFVDCFVQQIPLPSATSVFPERS